MFSEDLSIFFNSDEHAVKAIFQGRYIDGIFDNEYYPVDIGETEFESYQPRFMCAVADLTYVVNGSVLSINDTDYTVRSIQKDGTGLASLVLTK